MTALNDLKKQLADLTFRVERLERMLVPAPTRPPWTPPAPPYTSDPKGGAA